VLPHKDLPFGGCVGIASHFWGQLHPSPPEKKTTYFGSRIGILKPNQQNIQSFVPSKLLLLAAVIQIKFCTMIKKPPSTFYGSSQDMSHKSKMADGRYLKQETLLLQRDRARHLSVEILQLQNISLENPIV